MGMYFPGYKRGAAITPSDSTDLAGGVCNGIYVGGTGAVAAVMMDDTVVTLAAVPAGVILPLIAKRVNATGTAATNFVALYA